MKTKNLILTVGLLGLGYMIYKNSNKPAVEDTTDNTDTTDDTSSGGGGGGGGIGGGASLPLGYAIIPPINVVVPPIKKRDISNQIAEHITDPDIMVHVNHNVSMPRTNTSTQTSSTSSSPKSTGVKTDLSSNASSLQP